MAAEQKSIFLPPSAGDDATFPEEVVQPLLDLAVKAAPATLAAQIAQPATQSPALHITLEQSKTMIIEALTAFDPKLGEKADEILHDRAKTDPPRINVHEVEAGKGVMMRVRAAGLEEKDAMSIDGHEDIARLRSNFKIDHNEGIGHSIIDFEYDGTINSTIYLAHELGHAIADDYQLAAKHTYRDNPKHMEETQAYLVQSIVTAALQTNPDPAIATGAKNHFANEMAGQVLAYPLVHAAQDTLTALSNGSPIHPSAIFQEKFGDNFDALTSKKNGGKEVFDAMEAASTAQQEGRMPDKDIMKTLNGAVSRLHDRPTNQLVGAGIALLLQGKDLEEKNRISEMVLGRRGPVSIGEVLGAADVKGEDGMKSFIQGTIEKTTSFDSTESTPQRPARRQSLQSAKKAP